MSTTLTVEAVTAGYGRVPVLNGITLSLGGTRNVGLFGPNGHGKTTLFRLISGLLRAWSGQVRFGDTDITQASPREIVGLGLIQVAQGSRLFPGLTIAETLRLGTQRPEARTEAKATLDQVMAIFPKLGQRWTQRVSTLSGGERQMVSIAMALMNKPRLLLLDEPTLGLSPKIKEELCGAIESISKAGVRLVVVEQDVEFLLQLTDHLYLINHGGVSAEFTGADRLSHDDIMDFYFGHGSEA